MGFSGRNELRANAFVPSVAAYVYRLHFGRFATRVLKVVQYQYLTQPHDLAVIISNKHDAAIELNALSRSPVLLFLSGIFSLRREGSSEKHLNRRSYVTTTHGSNRNHFFTLLARFSNSMRRRSMTIFFTKALGSGRSWSKCNEPFVCSKRSASGIRLSTEPLIG